MNESEKKYKIAKGDFGGPFSAKWNKILFNGEEFAELGYADSTMLTTGEVAILLNKAYHAGRDHHEHS